jgi:hypothetical protein
MALLLFQLINYQRASFKVFLACESNNRYLGCVAASCFRNDSSRYQEIKIFAFMRKVSSLK